MMELALTPMHAWLLAGAAFIAIEAFGVSGIGFFFAGLGALTVGIVIRLGIIDTGALLAQFAWFFALTAAWAALLWKPLRMFHTSRKGQLQPYNNMVGDTAKVGAGGLRKGHEGSAHWSGTIMRAEIAPEEMADFLSEGTPALIVRVEGNKLYLKAK